MSIAPFSGSNLVSMNLVLLIGRFGVRFLFLCGVKIIGLLLFFPVFDSFFFKVDKQEEC